MGCSLRHALVLSFLEFAAALIALAQPAPRRPRGIYAKVNISESIIQQQQANSSITPAQLIAYFDNLYQDLLNNPGISGLALQVHWDTLNPNPPAAANPYDWSYVDEAFNQASIWNAKNPALPPKTIQLILTPGFQSPQWVFNQIPSCDGLFQSPRQTPPSTCGKATFVGYGEAVDGTELPLPWNPFYKNSWKTFLTALAARYGSNPTFVSIAVGGPTAASEEMIVPNNKNTPAQAQFGGIVANDMWLQLLAFHYPGMAAYQKSDQAFIDEWNAAIDVYGQVFGGVTLVATTGSGLPNFGNSGFTIPSAFSADCGRRDMDCAAEATILSHFADPTVGGANAKATQTSGLEASRGNNVNLGLASVKRLSQNTAQFPSPTSQIMGGAQFNTSFANNTVKEGCTSTFPPDSSDTPAACSIPSSCNVEGRIPVTCIPQACLAPGVTPADLAVYKIFKNVPAQDLIPPEQSEYNVLRVYFDGTPAASLFGGTNGAAPMNYLQIYSPDIQYAEMNAIAPAQVVETSGVTVALSAQDLLNLASSKLLQIGEPPLLPVISSGGIVPAAIEPGEWVSIYGSNLAAGIANWNGDFPTSLNGTSVTIDGKAAYLSYVNPTQINLQVPDDTAMGSVPVVVTTAVGSVTSTAALAPFSPSFFSFDGKHVAAIIVRSDGYDLLGPTGTSLGYPTVAAKAGDIVELFGTGFGSTYPPVPAGQAFSGAAPTTSPVTVRINNVSVTPSFTGLSGAGLYQFNLTIPPGLGTGDLSLQASVGGVQTPTGVVISLQ
jgi:uncharacterized protein (TIGR03437 family)